MKSLIIYSILLLQLLYTHADLPVHCENVKALGEWTLSLSDNNFFNNVSCASFTIKSYYKVTLKEPHIAIDQDGNQGFWTYIYDQGFELVINGRKYFTFAYYEVHNGTVVSYCDRTFHGWYHNIDGSDWGCYFGLHSGKKQENHQQIGYNPFKDTRKWKRDNELVDLINRNQKLWSATYYPEYSDMTVSDHIKQSGVIKRLAGSLPKAVVDHRSDTEKYRNLPDSFDWRNFEGIDYIPPVRNQASCGSCYAFGTLSMLESRIRLYSHNMDKVNLSRQDVVSCSQYSQGCDGGFPYLVAKYGEDYGIVTEECFPYTAKEVACSNKCKNSQKRYFTNYRYIGGYYGNCSEVSMMEVIKNHGPVAVSFEVYDDFKFYRNGIYVHTGLRSKVNFFEITNHVVLVVGWGVENGVKYWTVQNSWGATWGESGYFRIRRGTDECAIESMAEESFPK